MPRILVVDDSATVRLHLRDILRNLLGSQCTIEEACDRPQAERALLGGAADFVFLDMMLPWRDKMERIGGALQPSQPLGGREGLAVLDLILDGAPRTRVVIISGLPREDERIVEAISRGAAAYLRKPLTTPAVASVLAHGGMA